jgi:hypothetical protein
LDWEYMLWMVVYIIYYEERTKIDFRYVRFGSEAVLEKAPSSLF